MDGFEGEWHDKFLETFYQSLVIKYGEWKKVIDAETMKAHQVPTYTIAKHGLKQQDLKNYPLWTEDK